MIAMTPEPPYYAVIFTSLRTRGDNGYSDMAHQMEELAKRSGGGGYYHLLLVFTGSNTGMEGKCRPRRCAGDGSQPLVQQLQGAHLQNRARLFLLPHPTGRMTTSQKVLASMKPVSS